MFQFIKCLKMNLMLATDGGLEETATHIVSRQCVGAAGAGVGASEDGEGMIYWSSRATFMQ